MLSEQQYGAGGHHKTTKLTEEASVMDTCVLPAHHRLCHEPQGSQRLSLLPQAPQVATIGTIVTWPHNKIFLCLYMLKADFQPLPYTEVNNMSIILTTT